MRRTIGIGIVVLLVALIGGGVWFYQRFFQEAPAASGPITPVPLATGAAGSGSLLFQIVPEQSEARFTISEVLRGQPNTVVGKSNQVAGEIAVNPNDLSAAKVGAIRVGTRSLATDNAMRNRAIRSFILDTNTYEYVTFTPTGIKGLNGKPEQGKPLTFQILGDLAIRDVTKPAVFEVTAKADTASQLSGTASTTINRADYNLSIPNVPFVANVGEQVKLDIDFVAALGQR